MALLGSLLAPVASKLTRQLFGSGKSQAEKDAERRQAESQRRLGAYADRFAEQERRYWDDVERQQGLLDDEISRYTDELNRPTTLEDDAAVNRASEGIQRDTERASARLSSTLAKAGVSDSASTSGGHAAIQSAGAGRLANVRDQVAERSILRREQRRERLVNLLARRFSLAEGGASRAGSGLLSIESLLSGGAYRDQALARQDSLLRDDGLGMFAEEIGRILAGNRKRGGSFDSSPMVGGYTAPDRTGTLGSSESAYEQLAREMGL